MPLLGWYTINNSNKKNIGSFYFNNWFYCKPNNKRITKFKINFKSLTVPAMLHSKNLWAFQFHPEKSSHNGFKLIKKIINEKEI